MKLKSKLIAITLTTLMSAIALNAHANGSTASIRASENLSTASGQVITGSVNMLAASGQLMVVGIEQTA